MGVVACAIRLPLIFLAAALNSVEKSPCSVQFHDCDDPASECVLLSFNDVNCSLFPFGIEDYYVR